MVDLKLCSLSLGIFSKGNGSVLRETDEIVLAGGIRVS